MEDKIYSFNLSKIQTHKLIMNRIAESELIINTDGSAYHLNVKPEQVATTIITVGDQERVSKITKHFDTVECSVQSREFKTETGMYKGKRISVISTGIGTDNIDIVMNELDALVNINFETRTIKENITTLDIIRIGTSGAIQTNIPIDTFLISEYAIGLDGMIHSYSCEHILEKEIAIAFTNNVEWDLKRGTPYVVKGNPTLIKKLHSNSTLLGFTATSNGFYGPQGRILRIPVVDESLNTKISNFCYDDLSITNFEMETAAIYAFAKLLGHNAVSMNAMIANRANGVFSTNHSETIKKLILYTLEKLVA